MTCRMIFFVDGLGHLSREEGHEKLLLLVHGNLEVDVLCVGGR